MLSLNEVGLSFGDAALLDKANFSLQQKECVGLIGRNGSGKSSLLGILSGKIQCDSGIFIVQKELKISYVAQEPVLQEESTIFDVVNQQLLAIGVLEWECDFKTKAILERLNLNAKLTIGTLSGGTKKLVALAAAFVTEPDVLLLDEPTNHLDIATINLLENLIKLFAGSVVLVTHDRCFLDKLSTRIVELDRGILRNYPGNFSAYQQRKAQELLAEQAEYTRFNKLLAQEEIWIRKGIEARRTRSVSRIARLTQMRASLASRRLQTGSVNMGISVAERSGKIVAEIKNLSKSLGAKKIVQNLSATIMRGDKVALVGNNGVGKTTLLQLIMGDIPPDSGSVKNGTNLSVAYFDQMRKQLDLESNLLDAISPGSEWININNQRKHVTKYLSDFLFERKKMNAKVSSLSGGERSRLLLARLFAKPANVLVLDEPTNDLDIETLELLEEQLQEFTGTVFIVSHDRAFIDAVATLVLAFAGNGIWYQNIGGYTDYLKCLAAQEFCAATKPQILTANKKNHSKNNNQNNLEQKSRLRHLNYKEQRELAALPEKIETMEAEQVAITEQLYKDGTIFSANPEEAIRLTKKLEEVMASLEQALARWEELERLA